MNPALLGFIRALGVVVLAAILNYLGDVSHLTIILNPYTASIISALALALENSMESRTGNALFGAVESPMTLGKRQ